MSTPFLVFADKNGQILSHPYLKMTCSSLDEYVLPTEEECVKIPECTSLYYLPGRLPVGFNPDTGEVEVLSEFEGKKVFAVGAFLIPAYLRLHNPAYIVESKELLPLWAYTACGFKGGSFYVTAKRVDPRRRQAPRFYDAKLVKKGVREYLKKYPRNRIYQHLGNCALNYSCLAAKNLFLKRWEAPLPTSRSCNARCLGCLSYKYSDCTPSHERISFQPTSDEIAQVIVNHLTVAREPLISFGQGCEGEPLLETKIIAKACYLARSKTHRGTINMNTNASIPKSIDLLCRAGIDSFRVSLNSTRESIYNIYFNPPKYKFKDVLKSIAIAKKYNKFVSINLFVFPGITDSDKEIKSLLKFIKNTGIDMIQWRNLNIDPQYYLERIPHKGLKPVGILNLMSAVREQFPKVKFGYFNLPKEDF